MGDYTWNTINDFTPGIVSVVSANLPPGTAAPGTVGCIADRFSRALVPLPRISEEVSLGDYVSLLNVAPGSVINTDKYRIAGLKVRGPIFASDATAGIQPSRSEVFVALEYWAANGSPNSDQRHFQILRHRLNTFERDWRDDVWAYDYADVEWTERAVANTEFYEVRSNNSAPSEAGPAVMAWAMGSRLIFWPDDTAPTGSSTVAVAGDAAVGAEPNMAPHQGRLVVFANLNTSSGPDTLWGTNENLYWTEANDIRTRDALLSDYYNVLPTLDRPSGFQVMESLTADELLLIKNQGGAVVLRGDLNDYTAITYPYVKSPGGTGVRGTVTPLGFVYPVNGDGAWLWTGGQVSEPISEQLEDDFWQTSDFGQWASWGDWLLTGNNWLCDTMAETPTWWQLDDPDTVTITRWSAAYEGQVVVGTPTDFADSDDTVLYLYDKEFPRDSFIWVSQPLRGSLDREVTLREVIVAASRPGTITLTVTSAEDTTGDTVTLDISGTVAQPIYRRANVNVTGTNLQVTITSTAGNPDDPAPTVHEIRYAITPTANLISNL
jgi:hypothetical protein